LGAATRTTNGWRLAGLSLPLGQTFYLRARGRVVSGYENGSSGVIESVRQFHLVPTADTPPLIQLLPSHSSFRLICFGAPGLSYTLQATTNFVDWSDAGTLVPEADGWFEHPVTNSPAFKAQFYRLRRP
jgi:hypothetical protein